MAAARSTRNERVLPRSESSHGRHPAVEERRGTPGGCGIQKKERGFDALWSATAAVVSRWTPPAAAMPTAGGTRPAREMIGDETARRGSIVPQRIRWCMSVSTPPPVAAAQLPRKS